MSVDLMCLDKMCPLYTRCYRAQARPKVDQKYFKSPYVWKFGCNDYIPISEEVWQEKLDQKRGVEGVGLKRNSPPSSRTHSEVTLSDGGQSMIASGLLTGGGDYTSVQSVETSCPEPSSMGCDVGG